MSQQNIYPDGYDDTIIETATNYIPMPRNLSWMAKQPTIVTIDIACAINSVVMTDHHLSSRFIEPFRYVAIIARQQPPTAIKRKTRHCQHILDNITISFLIAP